MIGIITPLYQEAKVFGVNRSVLREPVRISDNLLVYCPGLGVDNAIDAVDKVSTKVNHIISWGTAAGLSRQIGVGSMLLPNTIFNEEGKEISADLGFNQRLSSYFENKVALYREKHLQVGKIISTIENKQQVHSSTGAATCDMESYCIGRRASDLNLKFNAVRFVTDDVNTVLPSVINDSIDSIGQVHIAKLIGSLIFHPNQIKDLVALSKNYKSAYKSMLAVIKYLKAEF